ncbi:MAG: T9SS type A sorting domain-containing protein [Bacteroidales bacterium]|jgi:hypothetical protein|nr:T9SS type A sorting domain-containing protein [Bacteroidales bacterium]
MKKIFTLILMLATVVTYAQSLSMTYEGASVNSGDTLEVMVTQLNSTLEYYLDLTNVTDNDVTVIVYKNELDMAEGATASLCAGGLCFPSSTMSSNPFVIAAHTTLSHTSSGDAFHLNYKTSTGGTSYVMFTFANYENYDDRVNVTFKLVYDPTGVEEVLNATKVRAYPNPASDNVTIEYAVSSNANKVQLVVKNLLGSTLYTRNLDVNSNRVKLNVSEYPAGIYFYSIEADGRPLVTKKLLVK